MRADVVSGDEPFVRARDARKRGKRAAAEEEEGACAGEGSSERGGSGGGREEGGEAGLSSVGSDS